MAALTGPRGTAQGLNRERDLPVAAGVRIWAGAMVQMNAAGFAVPAVAIAANLAVGSAMQTVDNTQGLAGAATIKVRRGVFLYNNSGGADLIGQTEVAKQVFVVDDNTLAKTSNSGARPVAGTVHQIDAQGVWVDI